MKWYVAGGTAAALGLGFAGYLFFSRSPAADVAWASPWFVLCGLTGVNLALIPIWSLLEGCNQVTSLYLFRFFQGLLSILAIWIAIVLGAGLWAASIGTAATLVCAWAYLRKKYRNFLKSLFGNRSGGPALDWRGDILPMQWRFAVSSISGYFMFSLFTPVLFHFHGPTLAGQFGMTWSVVGLISSISYSWIAPKVPQFGMMIALKEYDTLDRHFRRMTKIVLGVAIVLSIGCWLCVYGLNFVRHSIAERILPPLPTAILLLGQVLLTLSLPFSTYLRAHKKEPLLLVSVAAGLMTGVSTLLLGKLYAANGAAAGYFAVNVLVLPFVVAIWNRCRRSWHSVENHPGPLFPG